MYHDGYETPHLCASAERRGTEGSRRWLAIVRCLVLRRCQILLVSSRGKIAREIAADLGCNRQTVRDAIDAFNTKGLDCLARRSSRPHTIRRSVNADQAARLRARLHQSPRSFGKPTSMWTLPLAAEVSFEQGITKERVSGKTVRATLVRLNVRWKRARGWITSPDPAYARKKGRAAV